MNETPQGARSPFIRIISTVLVLALVAGAAYFAYRYMAAAEVLDELPPDGNSVSFVDTGLTERFVFSNFALLAEPTVRMGDAVILESVASPVSGEKVVIAALPNEPGTVLGIIHANGNLEPVVVDGTEKVDLHVLSDGTAVYGVLYDIVVWPDTLAALDDNDDGVVEEGYAEGPVAAVAEAVPQAPSYGSGMLYAFNIATRGEARSLGEGRSPRVTADGALVAITPVGLVRINPENGARTILAGYRNGDSVGATISANGSIALLHSEGNAVADVFTISGAGATPAGSIVSLDPFYGSAFIDDAHILLRTGKDRAALYRLPTDTASLKPPTVSLSIISPE